MFGMKITKMESNVCLIYNEDQYLIEFIEFIGEKLKSHYWIDEGCLYKKFLQQDEEGEFYCKARIEFEETPLGLDYMRLDGEARIVAMNDSSSYLKIKNQFRTQDDVPYMYSVKNDFLNRILNK